MKILLSHVHTTTLVIPDAATCPPLQWDKEILQLLNPLVTFQLYLFYLINGGDHSPLLRQFLHWTVLVSSNHTAHYLSRTLLVSVHVPGLLLLEKFCLFYHLSVLTPWVISLRFMALYTLRNSRFVPNIDSMPFHPCQIPKSFIQTLIQHLFH